MAQELKKYYNGRVAITPFGVDMERFCCKSPVAASDIGGLREIVKDGYNGVLFKMQNINDMVDKIDKMLEDKERMKQYSLNAITLVTENYNWNDTAGIKEAIYNELVRE